MKEPVIKMYGYGIKEDGVISYRAVVVRRIKWTSKWRMRTRTRRYSNVTAESWKRLIYIQEKTYVPNPDYRTAWVVA